MQNLLNKLFLLVFFIFFSRLLTYSQDNSNFTLFDNFYLSSNIRKQKQNIIQLNSKILKIQSKINNSQKLVNSLENKNLIYQKIYSNSLKSYYLLNTNLNSTILFILSANSINKIYSRLNYTKLLISYIKNLHKYLLILKSELVTNKNLYLNYKKTLNLYIQEIQDKKVDYDSNFLILLKQTKILQQKSNNIRITINNTYKGFSVIQKAISSNSNSHSINKTGFSISCLPLVSPVIISSFGEHSHPYLKNVKLRNDGLDLFSKVDTLPKAVADGIVLKILKIPNFGVSIILKHNNFYSVYSYMSSIYVKENDTIKAGFILGSISKNSGKYSFPCLNFQIWKENEKLDPNIFLNL